jgi:hypothetical protein
MQFPEPLIEKFPARRNQANQKASNQENKTYFQA